MFTIGIDPGLSGAVALNYGTHVETWRIPSVRVANSARRKNRVSTHVDGAALRALASDLALLQPKLCVIELVGGRPRDSAHGAFNFGMTCGRIAEAFEATGVPLAYVAPVVWRAKLGVRAHATQHQLDTKESSRRIASQLWPASAKQWALKTYDGHAEAALLSEYGRRFLVPA